MAQASILQQLKAKEIDAFDSSSTSPRTRPRSSPSQNANSRTSENKSPGRPSDSCECTLRSAMRSDTIGSVGRQR